MIQELSGDVSAERGSDTMGAITTPNENWSVIKCVNYVSFTRSYDLR